MGCILRLTIRSCSLIILIATVTAIAWGNTAYGQRLYLEDFGERQALEPSSWPAFFRARQLQLDPELRLVNGVSWQLLRDTRTQLAWPRITRMPNRSRMLIANEMLEEAHGRAIVRWEQAMQRMLGTNEDRGKLGWRPLKLSNPVVQTDIDLTYASTTLMSIVDLEAERTEGAELRVIRGLTFDLAQRKIYRSTTCAHQMEKYDGDAASYEFRFGAFLEVCSENALKQFFQIVTRNTELAVRKASVLNSGHAAHCMDQYVGEFARELKNGDDVVLYLTSAGLAVHRTSFLSEARNYECALYRTELNPVVIPYDELEPFMQSGAWRDELLRLR